MRILLLNQAFHPDVVSTAQHASDLARKLVREGHEVTVVCGRRAYDNPSERFPALEDWQGVHILRILSTGFGKSTRIRRMLDFSSFLVVCLFRVMARRRFDLIVSMTSPPLLCAIAALAAQMRGAKLVLWVMDLNPDQAIAAGWLRPTSWAAGALNGLLDYSLRVAARVVVLDRFMQKRIVEKGVPAERVTIIPPWSHDDAVYFDEHGRERFRAEHGLAGRFVVMYSGNHSPCHPLSTLLLAAKQLAQNPRIVFCFIGGGSELCHVKTFAAENGLENIVCLPYQPLAELRCSLSAADMHCVVLGDSYVGIVHPCKIYNVLNIGTPFLYIGPPESHVQDLIADNRLENSSYRAGHGEDRSIVLQILRAASAQQLQAPALKSAAAKVSFSVCGAEMLRVIEAAAGMPEVPDGAEKAIGASR
jgi:glycosyltransferase involved in cell wall biosynthesis